MKKWLSPVLALSLAFSLAACGSGNGNVNGSGGGTKETSATTSTTAAASDGEKENITLRMTWWGNQPRHDYTLKVIKMYEQQNPHVKIEPEYASWDDYWKKLAPQAAAGELPDILQMGLSYLAQYGEKGQLEDLTPYLGKSIDISNISPAVVDGGRLGDKLWGMSLGVTSLAFQYDPALLKKAGVEALDPNWTWSDYEDIARKAKAAGLFMDTGMRPEVFFSYYLRTHGKTLFSADGTQLGYDDDALFVDHFGRLSRLVHEGALMTPDARAQIKGLDDDPVVKGTAIGIWQWSNQFIGLQSVAKRELALFNMPGPNMKQGMFINPGMYFSVAKSSKHKEEAAKFISFFLNDVEANKLIMGDRGVPGSSVVKEALKPLLTPQQIQVFDYVAWAENNSTPMDPPEPVGAGEVFAALTSAVEQLEFKKITPEEAAKQFRSEANAILGKNKK
ncbi:ABC transporter substrate-binding protein [Paenibacillus alkalitolerans]|uniref:ABC transporter substrate-binding protein n=1 Tax=Paenibacillus alkalitolerans TaxID=2799335 RepID=UPI0018F525AC|nr:sugar ABC transporter substrate-binding protein [Paenibacillus alkalitolerans]